ncbi:DNA protecting protein DprA [Chryseobacterium nakagawai]|uniref:DNA-binding protein n=1 Tax=Chryseobacterium nakagawai TaxID=1241982 RepID=A0AAD0YK65_CHRNA|nr:DNA-processing protein DprA [Chryseobacterium nakagawai]AZA90550.1 DNA-binding protein [Chryseobacterium nakagawai]VEH22058.1 DNA protecting protein DprA [Chryseobacterium nakagawai]
MKYSDNVINVLTAKNYKGIGKAWISRNLSINKPIETLVSLLNKDSKEDSIITINDFITHKKMVENKINNLNGIDGVVAIGDKDFPQYRGKVKNSEHPIVLFYRGNINLLKPTNKNITVIGLLDPDNSTEIIEKEVVSELVKNGANIVSGLALGCDSIAHRQALLSKGKTIAILPSSLSNILPATNKELANDIIANNGLLVTEYYEDAKSKIELNSRYQERNRLQALFSDNVILSASYAKNELGNDSGSRLAMEYALNYSIARSVIYDPQTDIKNPKYDLNRQLINQQTDIVIINRKNLSSIIRKIVSNKANIQSINQSIQTNLFE